MATIKQIQINSTMYGIDATTVSGKGVHTTFNATDNNNISTDKAIADYINNHTSGGSGSINYISDDIKYTSLKPRKGIDISWKTKTWTGLISAYGQNVWTDGNNIYYSRNTDQYVLNRATSTWETKTWSGLTGFSGEYIWTDGIDVYYSNVSNQYVLNRATSTWETKTWSGLTGFNGKYIWTDGNNIYYSDSTSNYVLNKSTYVWSTKTWAGLTKLGGKYIWTDGNNIYYSYNDVYDNYTTGQYVLNTSTSTWTVKTWTGLASFSGDCIWTDGIDIYYSNGSNQYVLNRATSTWETKTWSGLASFYGNYIWTDGNNIYYSYTNSGQHVFARTQSNLSSHEKEAYPVGSIYMSVNSTSPASLFGGTWEQLKDKFLLGAGDTYSNGSTGGNATHSHTLENGYAKYNIRTTGSAYAVEKIVDAYTPNKRCENGDQFVNFNSWDITGAIQLGGSTDSGSSLPPYLTVYMWKRTA